MNSPEKVYTMTMILASASPRRAELLSRLGLSYRVIAADLDESSIHAYSPSALVCALAEAKAKLVAATQPPDVLILAADTIVVERNHVLGKPRDEQDAFDILCSLSGKTHTVFTAVCLSRGEMRSVFFERSEVRFRKLSEAEIWRYIKTGEPMDKAGAYGIQGFGALLVEGIVGDYFNVMGLPLCRLGQELLAFGVDVLP